MISLGKRFVLSVCMAILAAAPVAAQKGLSALAERSLGAVVLLQIYDLTDRQIGNGSGFFVGPDQIVSNQHVVADAHRVVALLADGTEVEVTGVIARDELNDLVVLQSSSPNGSTLKVTPGDDLVVGEDIVVLGSPAGLAGTLSDGIVSAVRPEGLGTHLTQGEPTPPIFQISAPISPGSSGSPVMNLEGEVIGVAVSQVNFGQNLNFAVPPGPLRDIIRLSEGAELLTTYGQITSVSTQIYARNLGISFLFFGGLYWTLIRKKKPQKAR